MWKRLETQSNLILKKYTAPAFRTTTRPNQLWVKLAGWIGSCSPRNKKHAK